MVIVRHLLMIPLLLALGACGFQPLYGKHSTRDGADLSNIVVEPVGERIGQMFRANLQDRLNPAGGAVSNPRYRLSISIASSEGAVDVAQDGTITRANIYLTVSYDLIRTSDDTLVSRGVVRNANSFNNATNAYYSTYVSKEDATKRGITELSEKLRQRLAAYVTGSSAGEPDASTRDRTLDRGFNQQLVPQPGVDSVPRPEGFDSQRPFQ